MYNESEDIENASFPNILIFFLIFIAFFLLNNLNVINVFAKTVSVSQVQDPVIDKLQFRNLIKNSRDWEDAVTNLSK